MDKRCLIKPHGFVGDTLFAASAARKLKQEGQFDIVDICTGFAQIGDLLYSHPWIDNIIQLSAPTTTPLFGRNCGYDAEFETQETNKIIPPPMQAQMECGVMNPDTKFEIVPNQDLCWDAKKKWPGPYIAYMNVGSWMEKAFNFTREEYLIGKDVPYLGYGGGLRDIPNIIDELRDAGFKMVEVGLKKDIHSLSITHKSKHRTLVWDAAVIREARFFIGAEGGLANIAAAVHTPTVLTSDFVWQLYGPNGVIKKIAEPMLGPRYYWTKDGHIDLNPYWDDDQVIKAMISIFRGHTKSADIDYSWMKFPL